MGKGYRVQRLGEEIRKTIGSMLIEGRFKDPALQGLIGVSGVDVSGDGSYATVYITAMGFGGDSETEEEKQQILSAFSKCQGYIRSEIGKAVKVRYIPELIFKFDNSFEYGAKMDKILDSLDIKPEEPAENTEDAEESGDGFDF